MVPSPFRGDMGVATLESHVTVLQSLGIQFLTTFLFVLTFFATVDPNRPTLGSQPLAVGLSMMLGHLVGVGEGLGIFSRVDYSLFHQNRSSGSGVMIIFVRHDHSSTSLKRAVGEYSCCHHHGLIVHVTMDL